MKSLFVLLVAHVVIAQQDLSLYGFFDYYTVELDTREIGYIYSKCMEGLLKLHTVNNSFVRKTYYRQGWSSSHAIPTLPRILFLLIKIFHIITYWGHKLVELWGPLIVYNAVEHPIPISITGIFHVLLIT